jgi:TatD DNase family protein
MRLVDSHAHLQADAFALDRAAVIDAAQHAGVERILVPGWDRGSSASAVELARRHGLDAAVGVHPHDAAVATDGEWAAIEKLAADPLVVAIGETGLDFDRMHSPPEAQLANLRRHLRLALAAGKPAILHCRSAAGRRDAVLHSFSGPVDYARAALEMGIAVAFGGLVFRRGEEDSAEVVRLVPADRLLVETDSPYLAPPGVPRHRPAPAADPPAPAAGPTAAFAGRRNSPEWVRITAQWVAERRGESPDSIGEGLVAAYDATFRRDSRP